MIQLPPGCRALYPIRIYVSDLTDDMSEWFAAIGGKSWTNDDYDWRGRPITVKLVQYGKAKSSYKLKDGSGLTLINFTETDASVASMFILKFNEYVKDHSLSVEL